MRNYLELLSKAISWGELRADRTGVGTRSIFGEFLKFDLQKGFPAVTTKHLAFKQVAAELACFLEPAYTLEQFHEHGCMIWDANVQVDEWQERLRQFGAPSDLVGRHYGLQWRSWPGKRSGVIDQIQNVIFNLEKDPTTRRAVVTAWNPTELDEVCLPPCHTMFQLSVRHASQLDCLVTMRSVDLFLGLPFDIASFALLTHLLAQQLGLQANFLSFSLGDAHVYNNHHDQVLLQLARKPHQLCSLKLDPQASVDNFKASMASLTSYRYHQAIPGKLNV